MTSCDFIFNFNAIKKIAKFKWIVTNRFVCRILNEIIFFELNDVNN